MIPLQFIAVAKPTSAKPRYQFGSKKPEQATGWNGMQ
jgi:hypothetical protein